MSGKHAFWQALIFTAVIFVLGLMVGFYFESSSANKIQATLINSETSFFDEQARSDSFGQFNVSCQNAQESLLLFADRIYDEAVQLEKLDGAATFSDEFTLLHRRYDLLRFNLWMESINLQKVCSEDYHTLVYLYNYKTESIEERAQENLYSKLLENVKAKYDSKILLIPMAVDLNLSSINLIIQEKNISTMPTILIDGKRVVNSVVSLDEFEKMIFS